jgi:hypothetical protein
LDRSYDGPFLFNYETTPSKKSNPTIKSIAFRLCRSLEYLLSGDKKAVSRDKRTTEGNNEEEINLFKIHADLL